MCHDRQGVSGKWRPTVDPAWPPAWERAADALLPLLDDEDDIIRYGAVGALSQSAAHADTLITRLRTCFENEPDSWMAERLVLAVGELARYAVQRREEALAWLRFHMTLGGKGEEPDFDEDIDAWIAWDEEIRHDVRLQAVQALRRAVPDHADPRYARVTTDALLASSTASAHPPVEYFRAGRRHHRGRPTARCRPARTARPRPRAAGPRRRHNARGRPQDRRRPDVPLALRRP